MSFARSSGRAAGRISGGSQHASLGHFQGGSGAGDCRAEGVAQGLVCGLEPCRSFAVAPNRQTRRLEVRSHKCLHYYLYLIDPEFRWMQVRLQTWAPCEIQVSVSAQPAHRDDRGTWPAGMAAIGQLRKALVGGSDDVSVQKADQPQPPLCPHRRPQSLARSSTS